MLLIFIQIGIIKTDTYSKSTKIKTSVVKKIEKTYNETTDTFLKEKYWFLIHKSLFLF